jgi:inhibitor of cysteine peptidase
MKNTSFVMAMVALVLVAGCAAQEPAGPAGIEGVITSVSESGSGSTIVVLVESPEGDEAAAKNSTVADKASVTIDDSTKVFGEDGARADASALLARGARVRVWFAGAVAESYPVQGTAAAVRVLAAVTPSNDPEPLDLTADDDGGSVLAQVGQEIRLVLESNPSTGYRWSLDGALPQHLGLDGDAVYEQGSDALGASGAETWTFRALKAGEGDLSLKYWRSFEPTAPPESVFRVTVQVR